MEVSDGPSPGVVHVPAAVPLLFRLSGGQQSAGKSRQISTGRYGDPANDQTPRRGDRNARAFHFFNKVNFFPVFGANPALLERGNNIG